MPIDLRTLSKEEKELVKKQRKKKIEALFARGFSVDEVCSCMGMRRESLEQWRKQDQMFDHHIIKIVG